MVPSENDPTIFKIYFLLYEWRTKQQPSVICTTGWLAGWLRHIHTHNVNNAIIRTYIHKSNTFIHRLTASFGDVNKLRLCVCVLRTLLCHSCMIVGKIYNFHIHFLRKKNVWHTYEYTDIEQWKRKQNIEEENDMSHTHTRNRWARLSIIGVCGMVNGWIVWRFAPTSSVILSLIVVHIHL